MKYFPFFIVFFFTMMFFTEAQNVPDPGVAPITSMGGTGIAALNAAEEFRLGIHAYNRMAFNEAILSFERALAYRPGEPLILEWLGRAYHRSGFEHTALSQWMAAVDVLGRHTAAGMLLNTRVETVSNRRFLLPVVNDGVRFVEAGRYPGRSGDILIYRQPTAVLPVGDGSAWIVAFGSNEIVRVDVNGVVQERQRGPLLHAFNRPYDLVRGIDGRLFLSEHRAGRISVLDENGAWLGHIGSRGVQDGMLVGPQNMAVDEEGFLYVVDFGNRRISKFDPDGGFVLSFGQRGGAFPGFLAPTGIAARNHRVYVADSVSRRIYMFDPNGNFLGLLGVSGLQGPESMRFISSGELLVADTNRILLIDTNTAIMRELGLAGNDRVRIVGADIDRNGNILAANFADDEVSIMTRFDDLASGLFVQVQRIAAENFPFVTLEVSVEDRLRRPIVGLNQHNFLITEGGMVAANQQFLQPGHLFPGTDVSILFERSNRTVTLMEDFSIAARDIAAGLAEIGSSNIVSVISAGMQPQRENHLALDNAARGSPAVYSPLWRFDLGLRLAATDVLHGSPRRSVIYVGTGDLGYLAFEQHSLSELAAYLANNGIIFNAVIVGSDFISPEINFLTAETGGQAMYLYRPQGIGEMIRDIARAPVGRYFLSFRSQLDTDFGRAWLPVEVEVYLMERSGRDNTGYFAPLQ
ncbi:MAG: NHL repeat-containing protein [Spirochaetes bacterium]|nr:NHL repeat-containing protein [Spirochaetota bacterium]